jgi:hypothetical protein
MNIGSIESFCPQKTQNKTLLFSSMLWHVHSFLGNDSANTFPRQQIRRQQSDNFRWYVTCCKYNREICFICCSHISIAWQRICFLWFRLETVNSSVISQKSAVEREWKCRESPAVKEEWFGWRLIVSSCNWLWLRVTVKEGVNNPLNPSKTP